MPEKAGFGKSSKVNTAVLHSRFLVTTDVTENEEGGCCQLPFVAF